MRKAVRFAVITAVWLVWAVAGFQVASGGPVSTAIVPVSLDADLAVDPCDRDS